MLNDNPLRTRRDVADAALALMEPLTRCLTPGRARLHIGDGSAHYPEDVAGMEGFSRVLWALVPLLMGGFREAEPYWALWREGLCNGTDPAHPEYWGDIHDYDQRMVEMAVIGVGLCFLPERFWGELNARQRENLFRWLNQINLYDMPRNNWRYFRILVNLGFRRVGRPVDEARLTEDLDMMASHYTADGWYFDYETKRDYYSIWGFQYYNLLYLAAAGEADPARGERIREHARLIAPRFAAWFDREGRALPYGRSLTYRFGQGAFFSAMAFAGVEMDGLGWGDMKGLWLRNLRSWLRLPILDRDGVLTVGYGYPNLCMAEGYNAPGSPYWGFKTFIALALPEDHPFWQAEETLYTPPARLLDPQVRLLITRDADNRQALAYTAGNHGWEHMHEDEKYEKFVYSTQLTFSVCKEATTLEKGAFDSMLAVKRQGRDLWRGRSGCDRFELTESEVRFTWQPMEGVSIDTCLIPFGAWHLRIHRIRTGLPIDVAEGAFALRRDWPGARPCDRVATACAASADRAEAHGAFGSSAIVSLQGYTAARVVYPEPNTNLMWPRTVLPMLTASLPAGEHLLCCAVFTDAGDAQAGAVPEEALSMAYRTRK
ncbi:MAG: DUF2264 domain-containing protein [Clostridia bacterium]|nr:DUF2264 domain-containing protein [Clostridia bacterium]